MGLLPKIVLKQINYKGYSWELTLNDVLNRGTSLLLLYAIWTTSLSALVDCKNANVELTDKYNGLFGIQKSEKTNSTITIPSNESLNPFPFPLYEYDG